MLNLSWNLFLKIFQNLNITSHEFKFVLGTHLLLQQGTSKNKADVVIFFFSTHFQKLKRFAHFIRLILLHTCKNKFQLQPFSAKKSIAKAVALNYISPKVYRITHHAQIFTATATTNATWKNRKVRNIITGYRAMPIWLGAFSNIIWNQWTSVK